MILRQFLEGYRLTFESDSLLDEGRCVTHIARHEDHRQSEAVAQVLKLKLMSAVGSQVCFTSLREVTQHDSEHLFGMWCEGYS